MGLLSDPSSSLTSGLPLVESIVFAHSPNLKGLARLGHSGGKTYLGKMLKGKGKEIPVYPNAITRKFAWTFALLEEVLVPISWLTKADKNQNSSRREPKTCKSSHPKGSIPKHSWFRFHWGLGDFRLGFITTSSLHYNRGLKCLNKTAFA